MFKTVTGGVQARGVPISADINAGPMTTVCGSVHPDAYNVGCSRWVNCVPVSAVLNPRGRLPGSRLTRGGAAARNPCGWTAVPLWSAPQACARRTDGMR
ncbi:hypothetical protein GCM10017562_73030 [Streptomyces roseofulvus]